MARADIDRRAMAALSEGERAAIVQCYHNDLSHEEAAYVLGCPVGTVKTHVKRIFSKLGLHDRAQAVILAYEVGLVRPGEESSE